MHPIRAGIVLGVLVAVWTYVMGFTGWYKHPTLLFAFFLVVPIQIGVIIRALGRTASAQTYGLQLRDGILLSVVGSVIIFFSSLLFSTVVFPHYTEELLAIQERSLRQAGRSPTEIQAMLEASAKGMTPVGQAINGVIGTVITGVVVSAVVALFMRRTKASGPGAAAV